MNIKLLIQERLRRDIERFMWVSEESEELKKTALRGICNAQQIGVELIELTARIDLERELLRRINDPDEETLQQQHNNNEVKK